MIRSSASTEKVFDAVRALCEDGKAATRYSIQPLTGLPFTTVDDRIKTLHSAGRLLRPFKGHYVPATPSQHRLVKTTTHSDGSWTVEVEGDSLRIDQKSAEKLLRSEQPGGTIRYVLDGQTVVLTEREDLRLGFLYRIAEVNTLGKQWVGFGSPFEWTMERIRLLKKADADIIFQTCRT